MTTFLLDVNTVLALLDPTHVHHDQAHDWFSDEGRESWATCPIVENGVVRILSQPAYPNAMATPLAAIEILRQFCSLPGHLFWPDDISLLGSRLVDRTRILVSSQVTDSYLLALVAAHEGKLATFDRRIVTSAVEDGGRHVRLLGRGPG